MTILRIEIDDQTIARQIADLSDSEQTEIVTSILCSLGAHAYQAVADYMRDNPSETERCPRCGVITFRGGKKGTTCHKCRNQWSPG